MWIFVYGFFTVYLIPMKLNWSINLNILNICCIASCFYCFSMSKENIFNTGALIQASINEVRAAEDLGKTAVVEDHLVSVLYFIILYSSWFFIWLLQVLKLNKWLIVALIHSMKTNKLGTTWRDSSRSSTWTATEWSPLTNSFNPVYRLVLKFTLRKFTLINWVFPHVDRFSQAYTKCNSHIHQVLVRWLIIFMLKFF